MCTRILKIIVLCIIINLSLQNIFAQPLIDKIPHLTAIGSSKQLIVNGKPFIMLAGELNNSSSSSLDYMETVWSRLTAFNLNTVLASVTWEMIEAEEGKFDFSNVDGLITKARANNLKLVFLWFGTWKNACSSYTPGWVRQDTKRFFRCESADGIKLNNISSLSAEACKADAKAFAALMKHIKEFDGKINTVLAIQVENEPGIRGDSRDRCPAANEAFKQKVPSRLIDFLNKNKDILIPEMMAIWNHSKFRTEGTWEEIFGSDANLMFMTWFTASYIDKVAAAGKAVYPLPMYANAWLEWGDDNKPGDYPSGGPIAKAVPVWQAAAPDIDILAPDIYRNDFARVCENFQRMGNPLFIPETHPSTISSANVFYAIGQSAICFSPFGIDNQKWFPQDDPLGKTYQLLSRLMPYLLKYQGTGKMFGLLGKKGERKEIEMGNYKLIINFEGSTNPEFPGFGIVFCLSDDEYLFAGKGFNVSFTSTKTSSARTEILTAYELVFADGVWKEQRRLNGDETDHGDLLKLQDEQLTVKTAKLFTYK